jgi:hypothetical protein
LRAEGRPGVIGWPRFRPDNVGEALLVDERLRGVMRDELGASPSAATQALHRRLLQGQPRNR